ncbi:MAG: hypothetical protein GXO80_04705 [Chlorobi bacterium]|nr:hypothetical protein [Chlorobiota bacterium]
MGKLFLYSVLLVFVASIIFAFSSNSTKMYLFSGRILIKIICTNLAEKYPGNFPDSLIQLPEADINTIKEHPEQGVLTYLRSECLRFHVGVRGKQRRGDYRGTGCSSCHIPYSDNGFYEGNDPTIPKDVHGHLLVHSIQSSRKTKVKVFVPIFVFLIALFWFFRRRKKMKK